MTKILKLLILISLVSIYPLCVDAQISPRDGSSLNYTLIGFTVPPLAEKAKQYKLEIAEGFYATEDSFKKHVIKTFLSKNNRFIGQVPAFGRQYTWEVSCVSATNKAVRSGIHTFNVFPLPVIPGKQMRLLVTKPATKYKDAYIICDGNKTMYNMKGEPVWFLPASKEINPNAFEVRDMKVSRTGTITFLGGDWPYEINYTGDIIWTAPHSADANQTGEGNFHHTFRKLANGNYMVMGNEMRPWRRCKLGACDSNSLLHPNEAGANSPDLQLIPFTTIIEYNPEGKVVWKWRSVDYFIRSDIFNHPGTDGYADIDAHANSFYFDQRKNKVYVSFKNINRIVVVSYPDGNILQEYGEHYPANAKPTNLLFSEQHCIKVTETGSLYLFNNNIDHANRAPSIIEFSQPNNKGGELKKTWEYVCPTGNIQYSDDIIKLGRHGGKVRQLHDKSFFVGMCSPYWDLFIVNRDKKVEWSAIPQCYDESMKKWKPTSSYRSNIVMPEDQLEKMIWNDKNQITP